MTVWPILTRLYCDELQVELASIFRWSFVMFQQSEMVQVLRASGHRLTPQRESVLAVIGASRCHLTADEVLFRVRKRYPYLNKSAVYRSLDLLTRLGLVNQTDMGHGRIEFELNRRPHHHHLICRVCGQVKQIEHTLFEPLARKIEEQHGFRPDLEHFAIFGVCRKCCKKPRKETEHAHS